MITIFNSLGQTDTMSCGIRIAGFGTHGVPANYTNFIGPVPCKLPPNDGIAYDISKTGFGFVSQQVPVGHLASSGARAKFKPCRHLNAEGTVLIRPKTGFPSFGYGGWGDFSGNKTYLSPSTAGPLVTQFHGYPTPSGAYRFWKKNGAIASTSSADFYGQLYLGMPVGNNPPAGTIPYRHGTRVYAPVAPHTFASRYTEFFFDVRGIPTGFSLVGDFVDHANVSTGDSGWYYSFSGSFTSSQIRGNIDGTYSIYGNYYSRTSQYWKSTGGVITPEPDKIINQTGWRTLYLIRPTQLEYVDPVLAINKIENDVAMYGFRVSPSISADGLGIARNSAIADITALKSNNLENIAGLKGSLSIFATLIQGAAAVKSGNLKLAAKALSSAYLWYSFALAPTLSDSKDIAENTEKIVREITVNPFSNERRRGRHVANSDKNLGEFTWCVVYHTRLRDNVFSQCYEALQRFGLHPSLKQGWDFVPLSFVVDWFTATGPILEKIDNYMSFLLNRDIKARIESFKAIDSSGRWFSSAPELYVFIGTNKISFYDRTIHSGVGPMDPFVGQTLSGNRSSQWLQGTSLLIQQLD